MAPATSNEADKPVFLFVTGAWHPPVCYESLRVALADKGYECVIPRMPSMGTGGRGLTWEADKAAVVAAAEPLFAEGRSVVLVGHSYGGIPSAAATQGHAVHERAARGDKGGFDHIVFLTAFSVPVRGWDLLTTFGGKWPEWQTTEEAYTKNKLSQINEVGIPLVYNDTTEEEARRIFALTEPHSQDAFETGVDFIPSDITISKSYVICDNDLIMPVAAQEQMIRSAPGMKAFRLAAGHSPFLGKADETAELLIKIANGAEGVAL